MVWYSFFLLQTVMQPIFPAQFLNAHLIWLSLKLSYQHPKVQMLNINYLPLFSPSCLWIFGSLHTYSLLPSLSPYPSNPPLSLFFHLHFSSNILCMAKWLPHNPWPMDLPLSSYGRPCLPTASQPAVFLHHCPPPASPLLHSLPGLGFSSSSWIPCTLEWWNTKQHSSSVAVL